MNLRKCVNLTALNTFCVKIAFFVTSLRCRDKICNFYPKKGIFRAQKLKISKIGNMVQKKIPPLFIDISHMQYTIYLVAINKLLGSVN